MNAVSAALAVCLKFLGLGRLSEFVRCLTNTRSRAQKAEEQQRVAGMREGARQFNREMRERTAEADAALRRLRAQIELHRRGGGHAHPR